MPTQAIDMNKPAPNQNPLAGVDAGKVAAIQQAMLSILPDGHFKNELVNFWKNPNPVTGIKGILNLFKGRKYRSGQYRLGERLLDNIIGEGNAIGSYKEVPDEVYEAANLFFTSIMGVRIATDEDIYALFDGPQAYMSRPGNQDANPDAVRRAVYLIKNFYDPFATFNIRRWDLRHVQDNPLVAPIPDPREGYVGSYYTGPLVGGGQARNGIIMGSPIVETKQDVVDPVTGEKQPVNILKSGLLIPGIITILLIIGWYFYGKGKK